MNASSTNNDLINNVNILGIKGSRIKCNGYRTPTKVMHIILTITSEASRQFRKERNEYQRGKINETDTNRQKNTRDLYRDINEFKKGYPPTTNIVKDENGVWRQPPSILNRWKNHFSQLLNVYRGLC
jgi:hypothetical protein